MRIIMIGILMVSTFSFASEMLVKDESSFFVNLQTDRNADYHNFLNRVGIDDIQARLKFDQYKNKLYNLNERIYSYKDQISRISNSRKTTANLNQLGYLKERMEALVGEHDKLLAEIKQWADSLK